MKLTAKVSGDISTSASYCVQHELELKLSSFNIFVDALIDETQEQMPASSLITRRGDFLFKFIFEYPHQDSFRGAVSYK